MLKVSFFNEIILYRPYLAPLFQSVMAAQKPFHTQNLPSGRLLVFGMPSAERSSKANSRRLSGSSTRLPVSGAQ